MVDDFASPAQVTAMMDSSDNMLSSYQPDQATVYSVSGNVGLPFSIAASVRRCNLRH